MPFTLSHTIAIVPFYRYYGKYFSISGLIMGSMSPDFEFFLRITLYGIWGHTFKGIFFFDLPVSIVLLFIFHLWVRDALIAFLPRAFATKYHQYFKFNWIEYFKNNFIKVIFSILIGIFTHFAWDNFTHEPNYVSPIYFDFLQQNLAIFGFKLPLYSLLQIFSSIVGLAWFLHVIFLQIKFNKFFEGFSTKLNFWKYVLLLLVFIFCVRYFVGVPNEKPIGQIVVVFIGAYIYSLIIVSIFYPKPNEIEI